MRKQESLRENGGKKDIENQKEIVLMTWTNNREERLGDKCY